MKRVSVCVLGLAINMSGGTCFAEQGISVNDVFPQPLQGWQVGKISVQAKSFSPQFWGDNPIMATLVGERAFRTYFGPNGAQIKVTIDNTDCEAATVIVSLHKDPAGVREIIEAQNSEFKIEPIFLGEWSGMATWSADGGLLAQSYNISGCLVVDIEDSGDKKNPRSSEYMEAYLKMMDFRLIKRYADKRFRAGGLFELPEGDLERLR